MPPKEKKRKHETSDTDVSTQKKKKRSPESGNILPPPEEQTSVKGSLVGNLFLLADRLEKVHKLSSDSKFYKRYKEEPNPKLGEGNFGEVLKFRYTRTNKVYAVKIVNKEETWEESSAAWLKLSMYCEAACFAEILPKHRHIIDIAVICESPSNIYYVMECLSKFNLTTSYRSFTSTEARRCFYRILQALDHLHKHGIIHGDLKMDNICVRQHDKTNPVLVDFGCCTYNSLRVQEKLDTFKEKDVFTRRELKEMRKSDIEDDIKQLPDILEMFLTGETKILDRSKHGSSGYPRKPGTDLDALALLGFMRDAKNLQDSSVDQLMEHCWFDPERAQAAGSSG